ncbi:MAG TPA: exo-alpha-sialidase [Gemmatimonadales bacterium]|nr:exo-alpha-sialidase [Gemmatimonadales bacterium]
MLLVATGCNRTGGMQVTPLQSPSAGGTQSADPALAAVPGSGTLVMSWIEGNGTTWGLYSAVSTHGGTEWPAPAPVAGGAEAPGEVHPHGESSPRLVAGPGERLALVWPNQVVVPGRKWPAAMLRFSRSMDGGRHWSVPITLNDDTTGAPVSHQFHGAAWVKDSGLVVAWLDEREVPSPIALGASGHDEHAAEPDATIYVTSSSDFGRTWTSNVVAWRAACPCCRISLARDPHGDAIAAWRKHFPGNIRDVVTARLGLAPGAPERVHPDDWAYAGCPHTGPAIAAGESSTHVVWYNGRENKVGVYYARLPDEQTGRGAVALVAGPSLGVAHPAIAALADGGALAAYDVSPGGSRRIELARLGPDGRVAGRVAIEGSEGGKYPQLAVLSDTSAVVGWTALDGEESRVRLARVTLR